MATASVLHVSQVGEYGVARVVANLTKAQVELGWQVSVAGPPDTWLHDAVVDSGARWFDWSATRDASPRVAHEVRSLGRIVAVVRPEVLHLHSSKAGLAGRMAVRGRIPTIFEPHAWSFLAVRGATRLGAIAWERLGARWTDLLLCVSDGEHDEGRARGIHPRRSRVVRNAVDTDAYAPSSRAEARQALGLDDAPLAVCAARLAVAHKGQDALLDAWERVASEVPAARLALIGDGPDRNELVSRAPSSVLILGARDDVPAWFAAANVVVQASRYEGLSMSVLEALACGRSLVVTDAAGMRDVVGDAGAVVPVDDTTAVAAALVHRLVDSDLADMEGRRGRARALAHFGTAAWSRAMNALTLEIASTGRNP